MTLHKSQDERHRDILKAARGRFVADGYAGARLNDVAADAGLSKGGVYFHFKSKREIFDALISEDFARVMDGLEAMRGVPGSVADKLLFFARGGLQVAIADPVVPKFQVVIAEMALAHEDVRARLTEFHEAFVAAVRATLVAAVAGGELRGDLDVDTAARVLVATMDGVRGALAAEFQDAPTFERLLAGGTRLLIEGLLPGGTRLSA